MAIRYVRVSVDVRDCRWFVEVDCDYGCVTAIDDDHEDRRGCCHDDLGCLVGRGHAIGCDRGGHEAGGHCGGHLLESPSREAVDCCYWSYQLDLYSANHDENYLEEQLLERMYPTELREQ